MSRRRNRHRKRNTHPPPAKKKNVHGREKLRLASFRKQCYCNADGFLQLLQLLKRKGSPPERGLEYCHAAKRNGLKVSAVVSEVVDGEEVEPTLGVKGASEKTATQVVTSQVDLHYKKGVFIGCSVTTAADENLEFLMDCLEVMDWEHTCSHIFHGEDHPLQKTLGQVGFSCENTKPWGGEDWRMEWFSDPDMMDLSYESCRE